MLSLPFFERLPDQSVIYKGNGEKYERAACTRGKDYLLVYSYTGHRVGIDLAKISGRCKRVWLMDTRDGSLAYNGEYVDGKEMFDIPAENVLIAVDDSKGYVGVSQDNIIGKTVTNYK